MLFFNLFRSTWSELAGERRNRWLPLLVLLVFALLYLPFLGKALHIDDPSFLRLGHQYGWYPVDSTGGSLPHRSSHPFLIPYLLKLLTALFGENEIFLHSCYLVFPLLALVALLQLYCNLFPTETRYSALLAILFLATPAVTVNAQTLMADLPALALLLGAVACYTDPQRRPAVLLGGGLLLGLAGLCAYQYLFLWPLLGLYHLRELRRTPWLLAALLLPMLIVGGWLAAVYLRYDYIPMVRTGDRPDISGEVKTGLRESSLAGKLLFNLACLGMSSLFAWLALFSLGDWKRRLLLLAASAALTGVLGSVTQLPPTLPGQLLLGGLIFVGLEALWLATRQLPRSGYAPQTLLLIGWIGATLVYNMWLMPFGSARYLLPALPPLLILLLNALQDRPLRPALQVTLAFLAVLLGLAAAISDYRLANSYRTMASEVQDYLAANPSNSVWYIGKWGMRYYMDKAGAKLLRADSNQPRRGDLVIIPEMPKFWIPSRQLRARLQPGFTREFNSGLPLRLFQRKSGAGFYCHYWGLLPLSFSKSSDETFTILSVAY